MTIPSEVREAILRMADYWADNAPMDKSWGKTDDVVRQWLNNLPEPPTPSWSAAPEWAMWWAVDDNEIAYWYEQEPQVSKSWDAWEQPPNTDVAEDDYCELEIGIDWRTCKVKRPEAHNG